MTIVRSYRALPGVDPDTCYYCGAGATARDHVAPVSYTNHTPVSDDLLVKVPACTDCNGSFGGKFFESLQAKAEWQADRLERKLGGTLALDGEWTDAELREFGPSLRKTLRAKRAQRRILVQRAEWARELASRG